MGSVKAPFLCGGVLFSLLSKAVYKKGTAREHQAGIKDAHSEPILMRDLIYTFTGSTAYGAAKDTSLFKNCLINGSINVPFDDIDLTGEYNKKVTENYEIALRRMDEFVECHFDPGKKERFVKAVLEIIEKDADILEEDIFFLNPDNNPVTKAEIRGMTAFDLSAFLVGVLHYILTNRITMNEVGKATLDSFGKQKYGKPREFTRRLGEEITREIEVSFLPERHYADSNLPEDRATGKSDSVNSTNALGEKPKQNTVEPPFSEPESENGQNLLDAMSDDEVINGALRRSGEAILSVIEKKGLPNINTDDLAGTLANVVAGIKANTENVKMENIESGMKLAAAAFEAQKRVMADNIRKSYRHKSTTSDPGSSDEEEAASESAKEDKKETITHQQTNVIQNGNNNINVTNNGTMNFNF